jgi:hypothetical protein
MLRNAVLSVLICSCVVACPALALAAEGDSSSHRAIRRSDVVFMYDSPEMYEPYGCTVMGWSGGRDKKRIELAHSKGVRHFSCSVGFLTEGRGVIDFSEDFLDAACRNLAGEPFGVPWLWDQKHKEQSYWWCTNSPLYQEYLAKRLEETVAAGPDGLHIDDYQGTSGSLLWLSGGFCRHCMAGFREYLSENVPRKKLAELGITDLAKFDYRQFLLEEGVKPEEYNKRRSGLPLADEFYNFQVKTNTRFVGRYRKQGEAICGKPITLCVNSALNSPQALAIASELSYFCCEVHHGTAGLAPAKHPVYIYKLADGVDRPVTCTASGHDWAYVCEHNKPCLVRSWVALSYAFGQTLMAPHRQWCYTEEKGTHWYAGPTEEYAYVYRFVRDNARLFDDYQAVASVGVVYDNGANRKGRGKIEPICVALAERNIPYTVLVAGDDWLDYRLDGGRLAEFKTVILATDTKSMDREQAQLIGKVAADGRVIEWPNEEKLGKLVPPPIKVDGSDHVMVVPRMITGDVGAPVVLHLLNRRYDGQADVMVAHKDITVRFANDLFAGRQFTKATLHAPKSESIEVETDVADGFTSVKIPTLSLWAIVEMND